MEKRIDLFRQGGVWTADFSRADDAATIYQLFNSYELPTAYRANASIEVVVQALHRKNPGHTIYVQEDR